MLDVVPGPSAAGAPLAHLQGSFVFLGETASSGPTISFAI